MLYSFDRHMKRQLIAGMSDLWQFIARYNRLVTFQRCKIINDVKNSIERGDDILLIDMEMIYESLYDVLNQYYKEWQGNK